ncbi:PP2C family protein-serine/threonine phosphatase [Amycolatopsis aidingensis]|uniref:PP2C family protein-serine/threonine phosphatase n=1 Tax=Amycolatopsis aidingensis TaxID=2842453 RepID=UPI001C0E1DFD|nr:PP2C family protein-serine/threonine phosphatase [Amycolatopsis aidingensis]
MLGNAPKGQEVGPDGVEDRTQPPHARRTIQALLQLAVPYLADWAMLAVRDGGSTTLFAHASDGTRTGPLRPGPPEEVAAWLNRIHRLRRAERLPEAGKHTGLAMAIPDESLRRQVAALLPAEVLGASLGSCGGALVLVRAGGRRYAEPELALAEEFARRAEFTLDAVRTHEQRAEVATVLQASLRPPRLPEVAGVRVAARCRSAFAHLDIGGDFYDLHGAGDDWSLVIGDVCGKGVDAAVLTGRARQTIRTAAHFDRSPSAVLAALNDVLYEGDSDRFVTVVCARLRPDPVRGRAEVTLAIAGHPAPIVLRADGRIEETELGGTLSGVLPDLSYEETTCTLEAGDLMLFFTDGIYEARGPEGFFGLERLRELLPGYAGAEPERVCAAVEERVVEHLAGAAHDDMALLALRCGA